MATIVNDRDVRLQATVPRLSTEGSGVVLISTSQVIHLNTANVASPTSVTIDALQLQAGTISWAIDGATLTGTGMQRSFTAASVTKDTVTITVTLTPVGGTPRSFSTTVTRVRDGGVGSRGAGTYYVSGTSWSDSLADSATPGDNVTGDLVTIADAATGYALTKRWEGTAWVAPGTVIDGNLLVTKSVKAGAIDTTNLTIRDGSGNVLFGAGTKLDYSTWLNNIPTSLSDINSSQGSKLSGIESGATNGATFGENIWGQITAGNAATYIANAAISNALIGNLSAAKITTGTLTAADINFASGTFQVTASSGLCRANNIVTSVLSSGNLLNPTRPAIDAGSSSSQPAVEASGSPHAFYAASGGYGPFTGSHDVVWDKALDYSEALGDIVVDVECVARKGLSNTLFHVERSSSAVQRGAIGVLVNIAGPLVDQRCPAAFIESSELVVDEEDQPQRETVPTASWEIAKDLYTLGTANAVGEGQINVCGEGGDIARGDLIVTSSLPGKGMRQSDDLVRSYTVARAREAVTFSSPTEVKQIACIYLCG